MKFEFLNFIRQKISPSFLGVDIGTTSIKIVELEKGENAPRISNYAFLENKSSLLRANAVFHSSSFKIFDLEIIEVLKEIVGRMKPKTNLAIASIPVFSAFITVLKLPQMPEEELKKALIFQAKQYIPLPLEEIAIDWQKIGDFENEKGFKYQAILLIAVPQELIKKYQNIFKSAGLSLISLEIEPLSLVRSLVLNDKTPTIIVDIGSHITSISLVEDSELKFIGQTEFAASSLTYALSSSLKINPLRAEEIKRERGILKTGAEYEIVKVVLPFIDYIILEIKRVQQNYENNLLKKTNFERIILSGGGANLLGIEDYFSSQLNILTIKASPFSHFEYLTELEPLVSELNPLFSVVLGLGIKQFV